MHNPVSIRTTFYTFFIVLFQATGFSQAVHFEGGGEFQVSPTICLDDAHRHEALRQIDRIRDSLRSTGYIDTERRAVVSFRWPVMQSDDFDYANYYAISNYVDLDPDYSESNNNNVIDYNCGARSYDTGDGYNHAGTDIFSWPFSWNAQDNKQVFVVAAAPGMIIAKRDGNPDRSCAWTSNPTPWNAIFLMHSDGSVTWYGHLRAGAHTEKNIGDMVEEGEFLGIMGSSGFSSGPHLHFEVYDPDGNLIDPYSGACNTLNDESWWQQQEDYRQPTINMLLTHSAPVEFPSCPDTAVSLNESHVRDCFAKGETIYLGAYYRDQLAGMQTMYEVRRPDSTLLNSWTHATNDTFNSSWWYWSFIPALNDQVGTWWFNATFNGQTVSKPFYWGTPHLGQQVTDTLCAGAEMVIDPGKVGDRYRWNTGSVSRLTTIERPGMYTVSVTNQEGCFTHSFNIMGADPVEPEIAGSVVFCEGEGTELIVTDTYATYAWNTGETTQGIEAMESGKYEVTVTDHYGCTGTAVTNVSASPLPELVVAGEASGCLGDVVVIDLGNEFVGYEWSVGPDGEVIYEGSAIEISESGTYCVTVTDNVGCTASTCIVVEMAAPPETGDIEGATESTAGATEIYSVAETPGSTYDWSITGGTIVSGGQGSSIEVEWDSGDDGTVCVVETAANGCMGEMVCVSVELASTAVRDVELQKGLQIFPVPASDRLTIRLDDGFPIYSGEIRVSDSGGRTIYISNLKGLTGGSSHVIEVGEMPSGIYFLSVQAEGTQHIRKFVVAH